MATITPGYDFGIDEVPTFGKFIAQAQGLDITGLEFSDLVDDTSFVFNSPESNGSGASQADTLEGGLWFDTSGEMHVTIRAYGWWGSSGYSGPEFIKCPIFKLWRGGWDTVRAVRVLSGDQGLEPVQGGGAVDTGYTPTSIARSVAWINQAAVGPRDGGYNSDDTALSGTYFRMTVRGIGRFNATSTIATTGVNMPYRFASTSALQWDQRNITSPGSSPPTWGVGEIYGALVSDEGGTWIGRGRAWYYGRAVANELDT